MNTEENGTHEIHLNQKMHVNTGLSIIVLQQMRVERFPYENLVYDMQKKKRDQNL